MNDTQTHNPASTYATEKQLSFLSKLLDEADTLLDQRQALTGADWPEARNAVEAMRHNGDFTKREASMTIDLAIDNNKQLRAELNGLGRRTPAESAPAEFVTEGMYQLSGRIYKVLPSRSGNGRHYAQELTGESATGYSFTYAKGAMYRLRAEHRMTVEQAAEWGKLTSHCVCCGALLTDPKSVARGIGPDCAKNHF